MTFNANENIDIKEDLSEKEFEINPDYEILIVDDNPQNLKLIHALLLESGYKVRLANSGKFALRSVKSEKPSLILLDINMPEMDGFEVCEKLKAEPETTDIPIIFLSALKEEFDIVKGFKVGAVDFITKPFKSEVLKARINTHLYINRLKNDLKTTNQNLEKLVNERTKELSVANQSLREEIITREQTQEKLKISEQQHRLTLANIDDTIIIITNRKGEFNYISPSFKNIFGYDAKDIHKYDFPSLFNISFINSSTAQINNELQVFETSIKNIKEENRTLIVSVKNAVINENVTIYTCRDITELKEAQNKLLASEERLKYALKAANEGIFDWDVKNDIVITNDKYKNLVDFQDIQLYSNSISYLEKIHPDDRAKLKCSVDEQLAGKKDELSIEFRIKKKNDNYSWLLSKSIVVEKNQQNKITRIIGTITDINEDKINKAKMEKMATHDTLTELPNRNYLTNIISNTISRCKRNKQLFALLFIDLDRFKNINDYLGHNVGDALLKNVASRLKDVLRINDVVARQGGDEFIILLDDIKNTHKAAEISQRIIESLNTPLLLEGHQVVISPSIGIVIYPEHGEAPDELIKNADSAMYHAKRNDGNTYWYYSKAMNKEVRDRLEIEESLRKALLEDEFILHYQPKLNLQTGKLGGMEALVRWHEKNNTFFPPNKFIPIAEETGLIIPLGNAIISKAFKQIKLWDAEFSIQNKVAINISAKQFRNEQFITDMFKMIESYELSPELIELEITEAAIIYNTKDAVQMMKKIKDFGLSLAIDDFGTGYSSLSYLKKFPFDSLKIDMTFIKDMLISKTNESIVKAIIDLGHVLSLEVVAEGVESPNELELLRDMGCDFIQGYLYSKPLDIQQMTALLKND